MSTRRAYHCYKHTIRSAYHSLGLARDVTDGALGLIDNKYIEGSSGEAILQLCVEQIRARLARVGRALADQVFPNPRTRLVHFNNKELRIPLLNQQAVEWYADSPVFNFDFLVESFLGMHKGARTIYDLGGHHGVWAAYYSMVCGAEGRVYSFEPSILNIECSSLLFLVNGIENVVNIPFGVGNQTGITKKRESGALVDFIEHNIGILRFDHIFWERADFVKIDIEGFEYELLTEFAQLFEFCDNIHLELHIPHLRDRGLDYRNVYKLIPFERVRVLNYQRGRIREVGAEDELEGFCSLLITRRPENSI